ncbi:hypothetical protein SLS58_009011 [Diplodia intermedia]|uniref:Uncharacterized protein n=1 Tax=Diplodia intermedia TaxID=856260 RepID=A0ABR3TF14_9PEZI
MPAAKFACPHCESQYTRRDSLRRHIKLHHRGRDLKRLRAVAACAACKARKTRCSGAAPCDFCLERGVQCKYDDDDDDDEQQPSTQKGLSNSQWSPEVDRYVDAYFARFHPTWPFLHKASFSPRRELPFLVQAVVMVGLWATPHERGARQAALKLHEKMRASILEQQTKWDVSQHLDREQRQTPWPIGTCQAILLFLIFGSMLETRHLDGDAAVAAAGPRPPTHTTDRAILVALVKSARKRGMFNYAEIVAQCSSSTTTTTTTIPTAATAAASSSALLCAWTAIEEAKRFAAALHQVWRPHGAFLPEDDDDHDDEDEKGGGGMQQMPRPDADFLWDASDEADLLRRIGEERRRGARTAESEMQVLGTSWDDILREYVGGGRVKTVEQ